MLVYLEAPKFLLHCPVTRLQACIFLGFIFDCAISVPKSYGSSVAVH